MDIQVAWKNFQQLATYCLDSYQKTGTGRSEAKLLFSVRVSMVVTSMVPVVILITFLVSLVIAMVTIPTILVVWALHAERLLNCHLLSPKLHGVDQVVHDCHGPHWRRIPGFDVPIFPDQKHGEIFWANLEVISNVFHQISWDVFSVYSRAS